MLGEFIVRNEFIMRSYCIKVQPRISKRQGIHLLLFLLSLYEGRKPTFLLKLKPKQMYFWTVICGSILEDSVCCIITSYPVLLLKHTKSTLNKIPLKNTCTYLLAQTKIVWTFFNLLSFLIPNFFGLFSLNRSKYLVACFDHIGLMRKRS